MTLVFLCRQVVRRSRRQLSSSSRVLIGRGSGSAGIEIRAEAVSPYANGSCLATQGGTVVFASCVWKQKTATDESRSSFLPLTVEFRHKSAAAGRIPGNARRREPPRASEPEILAARFLDRAIRPRFDKNGSFYEQLLVTTTVEASDGVHDPVALATNAASAALAIARAPTFLGPVGCVRLGYVDDAFSLDPSLDLLESGGFDLLCASSEAPSKIIALELGCAPHFDDQTIARSFQIAADAAKLMADAQTSLVDALYATEQTTPPVSFFQNKTNVLATTTAGDAQTTEEVAAAAAFDRDQRRRHLEDIAERAHGDDFRDLYSGLWRSGNSDDPVDLASKQTRGALQQALFAEAAANVTFLASSAPDDDENATDEDDDEQQDDSEASSSEEDDSEEASSYDEEEEEEEEDEEVASSSSNGSTKLVYGESEIWSAVEACAGRGFARAALEEGRRVDGRGLDEVRPIVALADMFPSFGGPHGAGDFARGETRVMATTALDAPPRIRRLPWDKDADGPRKEHEQWRRTVPEATKSSLKGFVAKHAGDAEVFSEMSVAFKPRSGTTEFQQKGPSMTRVIEAPRRFCLHYEFPASAIGRPDPSSERRAIGHGALAERCVAAVFPTFEEFPYSVRVAATVLASNGSTSMATICAASLALFDAGVPLRSAVAGISLGLASLDDQETLLTDLNGTEDHYGDMDFKVGGTRDFVTAIQLDVKPADGVSVSVLATGLEKAKSARGLLIDACLQARAKITDKIAPSKKNNNKKSVSKTTTTTTTTTQQPFQVIVGDDEDTSEPSSSKEPRTFVLRDPRREPKNHAPRVERLVFERERLADLVGPRGQTLRDIEARYRCAVETGTDGEVIIFALDKADALNAKAHVSEIVADIQIGDKLQAVVTDVREFGALVKLLRNREGLLHISEFKGHPDKREELAVGQNLEVTCIGIDSILGNLKLSRRRAAP